jgi:thiosulfate/3-mercaptopyruvate sulfurtransferase
MIKCIGRALVGAVLLYTPAAAQSAAPMLVDVDWLAQHQQDSNLVLLHVSTREEYDAEHIRGARFVTHMDLAKPHSHDSTDLILELPTPEELRAKLEALGISDDSRIVVYYGKDWVSPATRVILALDYVGLSERTSLLNGGMGAWKRAGHTVTAELPTVTAGKLSARATKDLIVDAEFVKSVAQRPNHKLVDGRAAVFYNGIEPTYEKAGHIPGAINIPFTEIGNDELMIERENVAQLFEAAGIKPGDTIVAYCHIGQQATAVIFGARMLGHPVVLYDGAFQDWASNNRGPVEK